MNEFELEPGREADLRLSIFGEAEVVLDGRLVQLPGPSNWKRPRRLPLAAGGGLHRLEIRVHHPESFPAIQVRSPPGLTTPGDWRAALGPAFE